MPPAVVIPTFREAENVVRVVPAVRAALPGAVVLVVDDASDDGTAEVIGRIGDPRLRMLRNPVQGGVAAGLNRMLAETDSELVARMDADDLVLPWRFRTQLPALERRPEGRSNTDAATGSPRARACPRDDDRRFGPSVSRGEVEELR